MSNALALASAAGTGFGFRNVLINGDVSRINQRLFNSDWNSVGDGAYGFDRWKRSGTNIQQVVEFGNFVPSATYTLSGDNVPTQQLTSPASGHWTITVPNTARNVQLELGTVRTPFERRPIGLEMMLCRRYFVALRADYYYTHFGNGMCSFPSTKPGVSGFHFFIDLRASMRTRPSVSVSAANLFYMDYGTLTLLIPTGDQASEHEVILYGEVAATPPKGAASRLLSLENAQASILANAEL